jgi:GntR family transcriptional regulator/MocR family aminotransferase
MIYNFIPDKVSLKPIYIQLYEHIRDEIEGQNIRNGDKLPSIRETSSSLKLSKTTVESSYFQLLTEGYLVSIPKKGFYVTDLKDYFPRKSDQNEIPTMDTKPMPSFEEINYVNDNVHNGSLDLKIWKKLYNNILFYSTKEVYSSGSHQGEYKLRYEVSRFVNSTRGAHTNPDQIVVGAGIQYLIGILAGVLKHNISTAAIEYPGYDKAKYIFDDYGFNTIDIPVSDNGINISALEQSKADIVYVSPSHQYPTGSLMPIQKRLQLLSWAETRKGYILEDDYDSLIRFESRPVPCLQGLDKNDRVIYLGSFSKILTPALRISYMILPLRLLEDYIKISKKYTQSSSKLEQLTLAQFIGEGHIDKHLRKIKRIYSKKRDLLKNYLETVWGDDIELISADSGLHTVISLRSHFNAHEIVDFFKSKGLHVSVINNYEHCFEISLSYSGIPFDSLI